MLRAALDPFPSEQVTEVITDRRKGPLMSISEFRKRTIAILETEEVDDLPFEHLSVGSVWFQARLTASLEGRQKARHVTLFFDTLNDEPTRVRISPGRLRLMRAREIPILGPRFRSRPDATGFHMTRAAKGQPVFWSLGDPKRPDRAACGACAGVPRCRCCR